MYQTHNSLHRTHLTSDGKIEDVPEAKSSSAQPLCSQSREKGGPVPDRWSAAPRSCPPGPL